MEIYIVKSKIYAFMLSLIMLTYATIVLGCSKVKIVTGGEEAENGLEKEERLEASPEAKLGRYISFHILFDAES